MTIEEKFWVKVEKSEGCWLWTGSVYRKYGRWGFPGRKNIRAHRFAWELENGPIPEGSEVCHKCDNPACVRIDHLFLGSHFQNMDDMQRKGRAQRWEEHAYATLTNDQVRAIREEHAANPYHGATTALAKKYQASRDVLYKMLNRRTWKEYV